MEPLLNTPLELPPRPASARAARRFVGEVLHDRGVTGDAVETALLLTSELVTNALVHAGGSITVGVTATGQVVRVEVGDGTQEGPAPRVAGAEDTTGRGLDLVEHLARRWGFTLVDGNGKTVWFEVAAVER